MPKYTILSRVDAYVDYTCEVEAETREEAVDLAYEGGAAIVWKEDGVVEFDNRRVLALGENGDEDDSYIRGNG